MKIFCYCLYMKYVMKLSPLSGIFGLAFPLYWDVDWSIPVLNLVIRG